MVLPMHLHHAVPLSFAKQQPVLLSHLVLCCFCTCNTQSPTSCLQLEQSSEQTLGSKLIQHCSWVSACVLGPATTQGRPTLVAYAATHEGVPQHNSYGRCLCIHSLCSWHGGRAKKSSLSSHGSLQAQHFTISHSMPAVCITAACANTACLICVEFKQVGAAVKAHAAHEQMTACACKAPTGRDSSLFFTFKQFMCAKSPFHCCATASQPCQVTYVMWLTSDMCHVVNMPDGHDHRLT